MLLNSLLTDWRAFFFRKNLSFINQSPSGGYLFSGHGGDKRFGRNHFCWLPGRIHPVSNATEGEGWSTGKTDEENRLRIDVLEYSFSNLGLNFPENWEGPTAFYPYPFMLDPPETSQLDSL